MNASSVRPDPSGRIRTIAICFLTQNVAMGLGFGSFGPLMALNEAHFGISRTLAASGMSMITIALSLSAPLLGGLIQRANLSRVMILCALLTAVSYAALGMLQDYFAALACYFVIGGCLAVLAILGPLAAITRCVEVGRGKILGIVNLPVMMLLAPYAIALILPTIGRLQTYLVMSALFLLLVPLLAALKSHPASGAATTPDMAAEAEGAAPAMAPLRSLPFWMLSLGIGIIAGSGIIFVVHSVPFGMAKGLTLKEASSALSIYSAAGLFGTLLFGWLADKLTPPRALTLGAAVLAVFWLLLANSPADYLLPIAIVIGLCGSPIITLHGAAMSALFGPAGASKAMGYSFGIKLPFLIGAAPFAARLFEVEGDYQLAFRICAAALLLAAFLFASVTISASSAHSRQTSLAY